VGASYYTFDEQLAGEPLLVDPTDGFGNSIDAGGNYQEDFGIAEVFGEVEAKMAEDLKGTFYASYVNNTEADNDADTAYMIGGKLGTKVHGKKVSFKYDWREIEGDAVVGAFNDSDFGGGGTDSRGHRFGASIKPTDRTEIALTYIMSEVGLEAGDPTEGSKSGDEDDYKRLQIDLKFKF
jgi:hypothetical protein